MDRFPKQQHKGCSISPASALEISFSNRVNGNRSRAKAWSRLQFRIHHDWSLPRRPLTELVPSHIVPIPVMGYLQGTGRGEG